jgi:hypothetical protein
VGYNALIGIGMVLLFGGVLWYALKTGVVPLAPSHIRHRTAPKLYWLTVLLCVVLLALSVKVALTPDRRDERAGSLALHRTAATAAAEQQGKRVAEEKAQREREVAASMQRGDVDRRYAEMAGIWSDDASCAADSGSPLRISAEGLDFGRSHFHVDSAELKCNSLLLQGHYITQQGIKEDSLSITVVKYTPMQLKIFDKFYFICPQ